MATAFSSATQFELEKVMGQEIDVLRAILSNLKGERQALLERKDQQVYALLEERLDHLERFERLAAQLGELTGCKANPVEAIEQLDVLIDAEYLELRIMRTQMTSLLEAIFAQSNAMHLFLQNYGSTLESYFTWAAGHTAPAMVEAKKPKITVAVLEPE